MSRRGSCRRSLGAPTMSALPAVRGGRPDPRRHRGICPKAPLAHGGRRRPRRTSRPVRQGLGRAPLRGCPQQRQRLLAFDAKPDQRGYLDDDRRQRRGASTLDRPAGQGSHAAGDHPGSPGNRTRESRVEREPRAREGRVGRQGKEGRCGRRSAHGGRSRRASRPGDVHRVRRPALDGVMPNWAAALCLTALWTLVAVPLALYGRNRSRKWARLCPKRQSNR